MGCASPGLKQIGICIFISLSSRQIPQGGSLPLHTVESDSPGRLKEILLSLLVRPKIFSFFLSGLGDGDYGFFFVYDTALLPIIVTHV